VSIAPQGEGSRSDRKGGTKSASLTRERSISKNWEGKKGAPRYIRKQLRMRVEREEKRNLALTSQVRARLGKKATVEDQDDLKKSKLRKSRHGGESCEDLTRREISN